MKSAMKALKTLTFEQSVLLKNKDQNQAGIVYGLNGTQILSGYCRCAICSCRAFEGSSQKCNNCGHYFSDHWFCN